MLDMTLSFSAGLAPEKTSKGKSRSKSGKKHAESPVTTTVSDNNA